MRRNPANESVVEFVVTVRNSMLAAAEVMGAAETAVGMGYAKDFTVRVISEGASPALGIRFIYDSSDNVLDREGKITRILEKAGGHVAGSSHARRNPLPMETDPFHPSKWLGNSTKGAFLDIGLKGSRNRQSLRGFVRIEPVVSLKSGFPLTHVAARYTSTIPEHWSSEGVLVDESPGHTLSIRFTFETPEGSASWLIFYGPYRPAKASEWHPEAPTSLVEAARVTKRHFESLFGQARLNPRRNPEGERYTSLKEQAESALLWERIRNAKSQKEALAYYRAALLAAEDEKRLLRDRKKAGKGREPKALYTKEYLAERGMKRRNPRRNPHKVPVSLINRATLDAVGKAYETRKLPPQSNPDASVLWDMMHDAGCEVLSHDARFPAREAVLGYKEVGAVKQGSILHRWIVLDAIQSAESVTTPEGKAAIAAARAWVNDPSERNREAARAVPYTVGVAYAGYAAVAASDNYDAPSYAAAAAYASLGGTASAAHLRFRVLETMARAGVLPEPPVQRHNPRR